MVLLCLGEQNLTLRFSGNVQVLSWNVTFKIIKDSLKIHCLFENSASRKHLSWKFVESKDKVKINTLHLSKYS